MEFFKAHIKVTDKAAAKTLLGKMRAGDITELHIPPVPKSAVEEFVRGERTNIWSILIDESEMFELTADKKSGKAILDMLEFYKKEELPLAPILQTNLQDFVNGKRKDVATLEIASQEPGEELPGHLGN